MDRSAPGVLSTIEAYFDLMYDADDAHFPKVFHELCQVHGLRDGKLMAWSAPEFRKLMRSRPSPASTGSPRQQEIMGVDEIAPDVAAAKVRVRIGQTCFLDHLVLHRLNGKWLITSKGFHVERVLPPGS
ncbi:MAG TPA: nuclear transport factor 2 family protein [Roseiarcus sp.]|nr:nuclear transport factor 2 family protein [Roseiarcus sp.]